MARNTIEMERNQKDIETVNRSTVTQVLQAVIDTGVRNFCICPGGRNAQLISFIKLESDLHSLYFYDERSAAFFALGRAQATQSPVAVITTSGTAVAHLLPAAMEAYYSGIPLILITADRPRRFRGSNAPQTAEQVGIYGGYVSFEIDIADDEPCDLSGWDRKSPLHINICLEEPNNLPLPEYSGLSIRTLTETTPTPPLEDVTHTLDRFLTENNYPFVIVGKLPSSARETVAQFLLKLNAPVYLEAISGLREDSRLEKIAIRRTEGIFKAAKQAGYPIDSILRIGGVPTFRLWRDIEELEGKIRVMSLNDVPFSGLSWGEITPIPLEPFFSQYTPSRIFESNEWQKADLAYRKRLLDLFEIEPTSEASLVHALSKAIPTESRIFLGNSLPIREWDLGATWKNRNYEFYATRGLNGIDGQTSTFYGLCTKEKPNWGIIGDLTALHDMSAPWILGNLSNISANLVIINNGGGKLFERIFKQKEIQNCHQTQFRPLADLWGLHYEKWTHIPNSCGIEAQRIIEIVPDQEASRRFWKGFLEL